MILLVEHIVKIVNEKLRIEFSKMIVSLWAALHQRIFQSLPNGSLKKPTQAMMNIALKKNHLSRIKLDTN